MIDSVEYLFNNYQFFYYEIKREKHIYAFSKKLRN